MPSAPWTSSILLAQESVAVEGQLAYLFERLFTPTGVIIVVLALAFLAIVFIVRKPLPVLGGIVLALGTSVLPKSVEFNQLIGPLQTLRFVSRSIAFALLGLIVFLVMPGISRGSRARSAGPASFAFLSFQLLYTIQLALFTEEGALKGLFGVFAIIGMYLVFAVGYGRAMQDLASVIASAKVFVWVSAAFVLANLVQIVLGPSGALMAGRLAGVTGNPQMMGAISALLILANALMFTESSSSKPLRWCSLAMIGILGVLLLATGSRTAVIAVAAGVFVMFRLQVGRIGLLAIVVVVAYALVSLVLESPGAAVAERFAANPDTRTDLWIQAIRTFLESPIVGELFFLRPGDSQNGVESSLFRSLANMGLIGGVALLIPAAIAISNGLQASYLVEARPEFKRVVDFYLGALTVVLILNTFDGYAFGFLTFPAVFTYYLLAMGTFLADEAKGATNRDSIYGDIAEASY